MASCPRKTSGEKAPSMGSLPHLGFMVRELHTGLFYVVQHEPVPHVLAAALKVLCNFLFVNWH